MFVLLPRVTLRRLTHCSKELLEIDVREFGNLIVSSSFEYANEYDEKLVITLSS